MEPDIQEKILNAAREVFTRKGFARASMQEIADTAGINKGLLHYYKWDKRKLFLAVFEESLIGFVLKMNEVFDNDMPLFEKLDAFVGHYIDLLLANPFLPSFVINEINHHPEELLRTVFKDRARPNPMRLLVQLQLEAQAGRIREVNPFHFFLSLMGMCVFPFVARPLVSNFLSVDDATYMQLMQNRKAEVMNLILHALRKE